ncbi:MAG: helix-hairpin-helix domain-containing protein [Bacteroidia bacterium]|nr:helix-hairpin-helix domain-containing protein [Bacteroidia bacterium]
MQHFKTYLLIGLMLFCGAISYAQNTKETDEKVIADLLERLIENTEATLDYTDLQDQLEQYNRNKLNLNKASREQLQRLFFLEDNQINAIIQHRFVYGDFLNLYELQTITSLDEITIYYLTYFVTVDENWREDQTPFKQMLAKGKHEIIGLYDSELQQREGYKKERADAGKSYYLGNQDRYVFRYRFSYGNRLTFGYTGEKDMGEQFGKGAQQNGFDFNSFHFYYRPRKTIIKTIALGDYQINFGQGLAFASGLAARKSAFVMNVRRSYSPIRAFRSLNENEFLRGAAVTLGGKKWQAVLFGSGKYISTNFNATDTLQGDDIFSSVSLTGLHRTTSEISKRQNVFQTIYGGNARWVLKRGHIGVTHVNTQYDIAFLPGDKPYQLYNFKGNKLGNTGVDFNLQWRNFNFFGEGARSSNNAYAVTSGMLISLDANLDAVVLYRNFAKDYQTTFANSFAENSDTRNEQGIYTGITLRLNRKWIVNSYIDVYQSKWLRYLVDGPSNGFDFLSELQYLPSRSAQFYVRFRQEIKYRNQSGNAEKTDYLSAQSRSVYRFNAQYKVALNLSAKSRIEVVTFSDDIKKNQVGTLLLQDINWSSPRKKVNLIFRMAYFTVDDYNARVYAAENDVLYQYAVPLYQNSGVRYYLVARIKINRKLDLWFKYSETKYSNVDKISSGLEQINGNTMTDFRIQFRLTL